MNSRKEISKIAGPDSMAAPRRTGNTSLDGTAAAVAAGPSSFQQSPPAQRQNSVATARLPGSDEAPPKKKRHRAGKKRRNRRQSFIAPSDTATEIEPEQRPSLLETSHPSAADTSFYRLKSAARSNTSLESEALLDHRGHQPLRTRRQSVQQNAYAPRGSRTQGHRSSYNATQPVSPIKSRVNRMPRMSDSDEDDVVITDRTPLIGSVRPGTHRTGSAHAGYGAHRKSSAPSVASSRKGKSDGHRHAGTDDEDFDVNNPPSVPGSPKLGSLDDVMIAEQFSNGRSPGNRDTVIDIDRDNTSEAFLSASPSSSLLGGGRRRTVQNLAENDVCYPGDDISEIGDDEEESVHNDHHSRSRGHRRRGRRWPDLAVLDEWSFEEKEERQQEMVRAKKISEPVLVGGRLRPTKTAWHREEDDAPYRYTYFNETFDGTIHSRTISELCQFGASFKDLFIPDPAEVSDDSDSEDEPSDRLQPISIVESGRQSRIDRERDESKARETSGSQTPAQSSQSQIPKGEKPKRYGPRPTFWLDVLSPTEAEMKVLSKAFGIHQLTTEDILMQEPREKVELFQHYYFVNYRSFEQDKDSEDYMEPVNMYVVVFREGVISVSLLVLCGTPLASLLVLINFFYSSTSP